MNKVKELKKLEIEKRLKLAKHYLQGAKNNLAGKDFRLASDAAYNSAELAMKAGILIKSEAIPKRHGGIIQLFSLLYIKTGFFPLSLGSKLTQALDLRNKARYESEAKISKTKVEKMVELAELLIEKVEKLAKPDK